MWILDKTGKTSLNPLQTEAAQIQVRQSPRKTGYDTAMMQ
jgi:hypothetical protein